MDFVLLSDLVLQSNIKQEMPYEKKGNSNIKKIEQVLLNIFF